MSKDSKFLTRPKVRFSQNPEDEEKAEASKASVNQGAERLSGPKIRSVVILDKPVTLVKEGKPPDYFRYKQPAHVNSTEGQGQEEDEIQCLTERFATIPKIVVDQPAAMQTRNSETSHMPLNSSKNTRNINIVDTNRHASNVLESDDAFGTKEIPTVPPLDLPTSEDEHQIKKQKPKATKPMNNSKNPRGKENSKLLANSGKPVNVPKKKASVFTAPKSVASQKIKGTTTDSIKKGNAGAVDSRKALKGCTSVCTKDNDKALPKKQTTSAGRSNATIKPIVTLMPCHKYMSSKTKSSLVTKKVLYNITGPKIKPYVGPGVLKSVDKSNPIPKKAKKPILKGNDFSERLFRPEYNSIMCTVSKLEEARDEKIVTDIDNLPSSYKALINAKASNALDFPMNEAIYRNLVDLSVDEQQLPSRLTRSKDPEPREKDIVPVLSDFFAPEITDEYCIPISVKPCIPDVIDNWSPYKISDKIVSWKASMDSVQ